MTSAWIAKVVKVAATSFAWRAATSQKARRSTSGGMSRSTKRGAAAHGAADACAECCVCLEAYARRRTVNNGPAQRVYPFACAHSVCQGCDAEMRERGQGRCPLCREERTERLENDERGLSELGAVVRGIVVLPNGRVFFPVQRPLPLRARRSRRVAGGAPPDAPEAAEEAAPPDAEEAPAAGAPAAQQQVPVQLSEDTQRLVNALTDASGVNVESFRRIASAWLARHIGTLENGARVVPSAALFSVVRVSPRNP